MSPQAPSCGVWRENKPGSDCSSTGISFRRNVYIHERIQVTGATPASTTHWKPGPCVSYQKQCAWEATNSIQVICLPWTTVLGQNTMSRFPVFIVPLSEDILMVAIVPTIEVASRGDCVHSPWALLILLRRGLRAEQTTVYSPRTQSHQRFSSHLNLSAVRVLH